ncbi:DDE-type integrase/transposase/recombinase [Microvirga sp. BSC39]|uniref:DDE-type integrase/transposase/recombinase n=1 Tax=Microvirga sp. BSC39 TaxID=1549810 RepID=UPI00126A399E|nr:DDE-type integrase/transposase/recombinase [Microvirga sp. BSC39]
MARMSQVETAIADTLRYVFYGVEGIYQNTDLSDLSFLAPELGAAAFGYREGQLLNGEISFSNTRAAYRFLRKALKMMGDYPLSSITTDGLASYPKAIRRLQREGLLSECRA